MSLKAELIDVGTELLLGEIPNLDAMILSQSLAELGIELYYHTVVGDNRERLQEALKNATQRSDIIITTGGLGPTYDDLTKECVAELFGKKMVLHEESLRTISDLFHKTNRNMTDNNITQAYIPEGAIVLKNDWGTAPGVIMNVDKKHIIMLPGPPSECSIMFQERVVPYLQPITDKVIASKSIKILGVTESAVDKLLAEMMVNMQNPTVAPYARGGEVLLRVTASAKDHESAEKLLEPVIKDITEKLGDSVYGVDVENIETAVVQMLKEKKLTFAAAESCTGGMISKRITDVPGASEVYLGGICSYSEKFKMELLHVSPETLKKHTAVSKETALEMAEGMRAVSGADIAIATTGYAGPSGSIASPDNPVGTVYVAISAAGFSDCKRFSFWGDRSRVRNVAASSAFNMLRHYILSIK